MKGFKKVSALLLASAITATVGVGAVSFAAWQEAQYTTKTMNGSTGNIAYVGFDADQSTAGTISGSLVPYDQSTGTKIVDFDVPAFTATTSYKINVKLSAAVTGATFYATIAPSAETVSVPADSGALTGESSVWKEINTTGSDFTSAGTSTDEVQFTVTSGKVNKAAGDLKVYVVMSSTSAEAMNVQFNVVITLAAQGS